MLWLYLLFWLFVRHFPCVCVSFWFVFSFMSLLLHCLVLCVSISSSNDSNGFLVVLFATSVSDLVCVVVVIGRVYVFSLYIHVFIIVIYAGDLWLFVCSASCLAMARPIHALVASSQRRRAGERFRAMRRSAEYLEVVNFRLPPYTSGLGLAEYGDIADVPDDILELTLPLFFSDMLPYLAVVYSVLEDEPVVPVEVAPEVPAGVVAAVAVPPPVAPPAASSSSSSELPPIVPLPPGPNARRWASLVLFPADDAAAAVSNVHNLLRAGLVPRTSCRSRSRRRRRR